MGPVRLRIGLLELAEGLVRGQEGLLLQSRGQGLPMKLSGSTARVLPARGQLLSDRGLHTLMRLDVMRTSDEQLWCMHRWRGTTCLCTCPPPHLLVVHAPVLEAGCHVDAIASVLDMLWCMHRWQEHAVLA